MYNLINRKMAAKCIASQYPSIKKDIKFLSQQNNFAGVLQTVINYLFQLLEQSKQLIVIDKIQWMGWLYKKGNNIIKNLLENLFVRSFHAMKKRCTVKQWNLLFEKSPTVFKKIYINQIKEDELLKMKL